MSEEKEMYELETKIELPIAHRLETAYTGLCTGMTSRIGQSLGPNNKPVVHGHNYVVTVILAANKLNQDGMVMDFKRFKEILKAVFGKYDHSIILKRGDPMLEYFKDNDALSRLYVWEDNPTAEVMARNWYSELKKFFGASFGLKVSVEETAHNKVTYYEVLGK